MYRKLPMLENRTAPFYFYGEDVIGYGRRVFLRVSLGCDHLGEVSQGIVAVLCNRAFSVFYLFEPLVHIVGIGRRLTVLVGDHLL